MSAPRTAGQRRVAVIFPVPGGGVEEFARRSAERASDPAAELSLVPWRRGSRSAVASSPTWGETDGLLLHYVGYGYAKRGAAWRLVSTVCRWRARRQGRRLVTIFHEIYASGPPWRSSFWLSPVQRWLARRLAQTSDASVTSNELFGAILGRWVSDEKVHVLPVFSTIGEPAEVVRWAEREPRLVVFGTPGVRERAYRGTGSGLAAAVAALGVREVIDIGAPGSVPARVGDVAVRALGQLDEREVTRLLSKARFGFVAYPPALLGKSSIFSAYAAHGVCPLVDWPGLESEQVAGRGERWLAPQDAPYLGAMAATIAERAEAGYRLHSLARHAELHRSLLAPCAS